MPVSLRCLTDIVWPTLERVSPIDLVESHQGKLDDLTAIKNGRWVTYPEVALEEARRLSAAEEERARSSEGKASTYLLMIAALIALLTYLENAVWDSKFGTAPKFVTLPILSIAVAYMAGAGFWAFRTVTVKVFHRVDATDLVRIWQKSDEHLLSALTAEILSTVRLNREAVNSRVSALRMAHTFMLRGFFSFAILVVVAAGWGVWRETHPSQVPTSSVSQ